MRVRVALVVALFASALAAACGGGAGAVDFGAESVGVLDFDVSVARVRAAGWAASDATDAEALLAARDVVQRRLDAFDLGLRATVEPGERTLSVRGTNALTLERRDIVASYLGGIGSIELLFEARAADIRGLVTLDDERERFLDWRGAHPSEPLFAFHGLARGDGGPHPALLWTTIAGESGPIVLALPDRPEHAIGARDLSFVHAFTNPSGGSQLYLRAADERVDDFEDLSRRGANRGLAILLEGELLGPLGAITSGGWALQVEGEFDATQTAALSATFNAKKSPLTPR